MKKEEQNKKTNLSSGAEKVENIARQSTVKRAQYTKTPTAKVEAALGEDKDRKKEANTVIENKAVQESQQAKARVEAALARKKAQENRREERKKRLSTREAEIEKALAQEKARIEKHAIERKKIAEKRKAEREAALRERARAKANKHQQRAKKRAEKTANKPQRNPQKERQGNYGGWLAAVLSLGVISLALTTAVTVGAIEMRRTKTGINSAYMGTMYELTGVMEHVDDDLDRVRLSASSAQQGRILTDLLVQTRLAEMDLERLPICAEADRNVTKFINHTAMECERMLAKLRHGERLNEEDNAILQSLYNTNHGVRLHLNETLQKIADKDLTEFLKKGKGKMADMFEKVENMTLPENRKGILNGEKPVHGKEVPTMGTEEKRIEAAQAESLCEGYFAKYKIAEFQCIGETVAHGYAAYNVQGYDDNGTLLFAQVSQADGRLLRFDYYEECKQETFDLPNAERIAEEFLEALGYEDMEVSRFRQDGTTADFTFVYEEDDVAYYADEIRVKVCQSRGLVTGFDATKYLKNHTQRGEVEVTLSMEEARACLHKDLVMESARLIVAKVGQTERPAYEFLCSYKGERYFVFIDGRNGEELAIVNARSIA